MQPTGYARKALALILFLAAFRLWLAFGLELGNDESYYWMYSRVLKPNYFDHPPMVALLIRLCTLNGLLQSPGALRLGSVLGAALAAWFLFKAVATLHSQRAGFYASVLYQSSFYAGVTAGVYIMPDSPQMIFWTASLWMLARIIRDERDWNNWLLFAVLAGASVMSKVHGGFLAAGLGLFIIVQKRSWLRLPQLYVAAALLLLIVSPILAWNIRNDFITYRFHSRRVAVDHFNLRFSYALKEAIGQLVFNNPVNVVLVALGLFGWKKLPDRCRSNLALFNWIALPHAGFLLFVALFRDTTLPHWSGPAYVTLLPLAAVRLAGIPRRAFLPRVVVGSALTYLLTVCAWMGVVHQLPGTYGRKDTELLGTGDISLDLYGWQEAGAAFGNLYRQELAAGRISTGTPLVASYWWGAHLEYYFCRPNGIPFRALGPIRDIREYYWRGDARAPLPAVAYAVLASDEHYELPKGYFRKAQVQYRITVDRGGRPAHSFVVWRLER
ncbi:ArnT family glycosyltransferase [Flaviaesturariibacter terrae]